MLFRSVLFNSLTGMRHIITSGIGVNEHGIELVPDTTGTSVLEHL